jgi:hypothetical protein
LERVELDMMKQGTEMAEAPRFTAGDFGWVIDTLKGKIREARVLSYEGGGFYACIVAGEEKYLQDCPGWRVYKPIQEALARLGDEASQYTRVPFDSYPLLPDDPVVCLS